MKWKLENRKLSSLKEYDKNPRQLSKIAYGQLKKSLETFGLIDKPIINTDNTIIGGHQRIKVLKDMGVREVECYVPDVTLTEEQVQRACITFNKATGAWDWDAMANSWDALDLIEYGFTQEELVKAFEGIETPSKEESEDAHKCPTCGKSMKK